MLIQRCQERPTKPAFSHSCKTWGKKVVGPSPEASVLTSQLISEARFSYLFICFLGSYSHFRGHLPSDPVYNRYGRPHRGPLFSQLPNLLFPHHYVIRGTRERKEGFDPKKLCINIMPSVLPGFCYSDGTFSSNYAGYRLHRRQLFHVIFL